MDSRNNFYKTLTENGFYGKSSKIASDEDIRKAVAELNVDQIDVLAQELGIAGKQASDTSAFTEKVAAMPAGLAAALAEKGEKKDEKPAEKKDEKPAEKKDEKPAEKKDEKPAEKKDEKPAEKKDEKAEAKDEAAEDKEEGTEDEEEEKEVKASEYLMGILKEGAQLEEQLEKDAFVRAESMLKEAGYGIENYVYGFIENEKIAKEIASQAEKVASEIDVPALMVARDIVAEILESVDSE